MRKLLLGLLVVAGGLFGQGDSPTNFVAGGGFFNQQTTPQISGFLSYAQQISGGTYSYSVVDITSLIIKPAIKLQTTSSSGIAQYVKNINGVDIFALGDVGAAVTSNSNLGISFSGGGMGVVRIKGDFYLVVPVRVIHSSVGGTQYMVGVGIGWGK